MFVSDWMTSEVFTVMPDDSIARAANLMKERNIRHLPVVRGTELVALLSDRDLKEFSPSKATTLDIYELHYLFEKTKVKDVARMKPLTTTADTPIEEAAMLMHDAAIGCLPVLDTHEQLVGIITYKDMYKVLVDITGARSKGARVSLLLSDTPGSIKEAADIIRSFGLQLRSILTSYERSQEGVRHVVIRTKRKEGLDVEALKKQLSVLDPNVKVKS
ncbi:MAG TPA: CBS and ACT domain-containing protein [Dissulfurispiraceae bacterium]|nr:CBS and ACT domain-containing protein [Dissulfurispiraceae bacterium]